MAPAFRFLTPPKGVTVHRPYFLGSRHLSYNMFRGCAIYAPNQLRSIFLFPAVSEQYWFWLGLQVFPWQYNHLLPRCFGGFIVDAPISTVLSVTSNPFWWLRHLFLHFWNLVWFAAVPTGKHPLLFQCFGGFIVGACISAISVLDLQSLLGCCIPWVLVGPAFVPTGMEHQFLQFLVGLFIEFPISTFLYRDHVFYGKYSCGVLVDLL